MAIVRERVPARAAGDFHEPPQVRDMGEGHAPRTQHDETGATLAGTSGVAGTRASPATGMLAVPPRAVTEGEIVRRPGHDLRLIGTRGEPLAELPCRQGVARLRESSHQRPRIGRCLRVEEQDGTGRML